MLFDVVGERIHYVQLVLLQYLIVVVVVVVVGVVGVVVGVVVVGVVVVVVCLCVTLMQVLRTTCLLKKDLGKFQVIKKSKVLP